MVCWGKRLTEYQIPICEDTGTELVLLLILFLLNVLFFSDELQTLKLEVLLFIFKRIGVAPLQDIPVVLPLSR